MSHEFHRRSNCHQLWMIRMIWSEKQFSLSENQAPLKCDHPSFKWLTTHYSMNDLSLNFAQHCSPYYHTLWGFGVGWGPKYWRSHHFQHVLGKNWDISFEIRLQYWTIGGQDNLLGTKYHWFAHLLGGETGEYTEAASPLGCTHSCTVHVHVAHCTHTCCTLHCTLHVVHCTCTALHCAHCTRSCTVHTCSTVAAL